MAEETRGAERTVTQGVASTGSERVRRVQARVEAAVEASYLAQLGRDLRLTVTQPAAQPCPGHAA